MVALASAFIRLRPDPDRQEFKRAGQKMGDDAGAAAGDGFVKGVDGKLRDASGRFVKSGATVGESLGEGITRGADGKLRDAAGRFVKDGDRIGAGVGDGIKKGFSRSLKGIEVKGNAFSKALSLMGARATLFTGAAVLATPAALKLTAALLPAAGAVNVLPAALLAGAAAAGTFKLATAGVGDAIKQGFTGTSKQAQKALAALPPAARSVVKAIIPLKAQVDKLRQSVAQRFFLPLVDDIKPLANLYFPLLTREMSNLAGPLGGLGEQIAQTARKGIVFTAVRDLFQQTRVSVIELRGAINPLGTALAAVVSATASLLPGLIKGFVSLATRVSDYVTQVAQAGRIRDAFNAAVAVLTQLGQIVLNVVSIFRAFFIEAGRESGGLLANLVALTDQVAVFLFSDKGESGLAATFKTLNAFSAGLRQGLAVVLPQIATAIAILSPALVGLITPAVNLLVAISPLLPFATSLAEVLITSLTPAIAVLSQFLAQNSGILKAALIVYIAYTAAVNLLAFAAKVNAAGGLLAFAQSITVVSNVQKIAAITSTALGVAFKFMLGPIGLIITGITLLVAGIVYLFNNNKTFHDFVISAWKGIQAAISAVGAWFTGTLVPSLVTAYHAVIDAALFFYNKVILPVWHGIQAVVGVVVAAVRGYIGLLVAEFDVIKTVLLFLYNTIWLPIWHAISKIVEIAWFAIRIIFQALINVIQSNLVPIIRNVQAVAQIAFALFTSAVRSWWAAVQVVFALFRAYIVGPTIGGINALRAVFQVVFNAVAALVRSWWTGTIQPILALVRAAWGVLASGLSFIYEKQIKPVFSAFIGFIRNNLVGAFTNAVGTIKAIWAQVQEAARKPVVFVVDHVLNPFIGGLNKAAAVVGIKDRIDPIKLAKGGPVPGYAVGGMPGGKLSGAGSTVDNRLAPATIPGVGAVKLMGGEFVVNRQDTAKALPILKWINAGMKGGAGRIADYIGRPLTDYPGDGSEGWAFKSGGLVGWVGDVWNAITNPLDTIKKPFESLINQIPGGGLVKNFLVSSGKKLLNGAVSWLTGFGGGDLSALKGNLGAAAKFLVAQNGKPYVWASAGPSGYDCSGIVSAVYNLLAGHNPYSHTFSTESLPGSFFTPGQRTGPLIAGWSHPGQSPASATVGHMAGQLMNLPFESRGSRGVIVGNQARSVSEFANIGAARFAKGGQLAGGVRLFDNGGPWESGTLGANLSGRTEWVDSRPRRNSAGGGDIHFHFENAIIGSDAEFKKMTRSAIIELKRERKLP